MTNIEVKLTDAQPVNIKVDGYTSQTVKAEVERLEERVNTIITTPVEGVSAQEIIDARQGALSVGANITEVKSQLAQTDQVVIENRNKLVADLITSNVTLGDLQSFIDALAKGYVKIAFWGDSITTGGDYLQLIDTYVEQYMKKLREAFPHVTFEYKNFGIGGGTLEQAASPGYTSPDDFNVSWSTTDGKSWRDYVEDYNADLILLSFGMNPNASGAEATSSYLETIKIHLADKNPSLMLMNNFLPQEDFAGATGIEERILSSRETKHYAAKNNFSLLNLFNRYRNLVDGVDENKHIVERHASTSFDSATLRNSLFKTMNFKYKENITLWDTNEWSVYFRKTGYIIITKTLLKVNGFSDTTINLSDGGHALEIEVIDNSIKVWVDTALLFSTTSYFGDSIEDYMHIGWSVGTGAISGLTVDNFKYGVTNSKYTIADIVGEYVAGDYSLKLPTGGNGVNHPSSKGFNYLYVPLIDEFIGKLKNELRLKPTITKTITFNFISAGSFAYYNVPNEKKYPELTGVLEDSTGTVYTQNKTDKFFVEGDESKLGTNEFFIKRSAGVLQLIVKTPSTLTGWKYTTNVLI